MSGAPSIKLFSERLDSALDGNDWTQVDASRERLKALLVDAAISNDSDDIHLIEAVLNAARNHVVLSREVNITPGPEGAAWQLAADVETARIVQKARPRMPLIVDKSARVRILDVLRASNQLGLTNSEIKKKTKLRPETVARVLKVLRAEGLVRSRRAGKATINELVSRSSQFTPASTIQKAYEQIALTPDVQFEEIPISNFPRRVFVEAKSSPARENVGRLLSQTEPRLMDLVKDESEKPGNAGTEDAYSHEGAETRRQPAGTQPLSNLVLSDWQELSKSPMSMKKSREVYRDKR